MPPPPPKPLPQPWRWLIAVLVIGLLFVLFDPQQLLTPTMLVLLIAATTAVTWLTRNLMVPALALLAFGAAALPLESWQSPKGEISIAALICGGGAVLAILMRRLLQNRSQLSGPDSAQDSDPPLDNPAQASGDNDAQNT